MYIKNWCHTVKIILNKTELEVSCTILETLRWFPVNFHERLNTSTKLKALPNRAALIWKQSHLKLKAMPALIGEKCFILHQFPVLLLPTTSRAAGTAQSPAPHVSACTEAKIWMQSKGKEEDHCIFLKASVQYGYNLVIQLTANLFFYSLKSIKPHSGYTNWMPRNELLYFWILFRCSSHIFKKKEGDNTRAYVHAFSPLK